MAALSWRGAVDLLVLALALYLVLLWGREARALRAFVAVLALRAGALVGRRLELPVTEWVLETASLVALVLILVVFQSELRRAFNSLDVVVRLLRPGVQASTTALGAIAEASFALAGTGRGALVVIARSDPVQPLLSGGVPLGGEVSAEILEAIFRKVSPVHDGAAVVASGRISRVGAVLPLTDRDDLPRGYGTRHRAALGLSERCDALVLAVSEERGTVTLFDGGSGRRVPGPEALRRELEGLAAPAGGATGGALRRAVTAHAGLRAAALGLALAIWSVLWLGSGTVVRTVAAPVELRHLGPGLRVTRQSVATVEVRLRGAPWLLESTSSNLTARVDVEGRGPGVHEIPIDTTGLELRPGVTLEGLAPERVRVELRPARPAGEP